MLPFRETGAMMLGLRLRPAFAAQLRNVSQTEKQPVQTLITHADAIQFLLCENIAASRRQWALGDTVVVPFGRPSVHDGITTYPAVAWLVPCTSGWRFEQITGRTPRTVTFPDLTTACNFAIDVARAFSTILACSACGQSAELDFGERCGPGGVGYWTACRCSYCGTQTESDGIGGLPEELRHLEQLRHGVWAIRAQPPATSTQWKALQDLLQLRLPDLVDLKHQLPGRISLGTLTEAECLQAALVRAELVAELECAG